MTTLQQSPTIDRLLREWRGDESKSEAARKIGVSRQIYGAWEDAHFVPGDEWVEPLAVQLDRDIQDIVWILYRSRIAKNRVSVMGLTTHRAFAYAA